MTKWSCVFNPVFGIIHCWGPYGKTQVLPSSFLYMNVQNEVYSTSILGQTGDFAYYICAMQVILSNFQLHGEVLIAVESTIVKFRRLRRRWSDQTQHPITELRSEENSSSCLEKGSFRTSPDVKMISIILLLTKCPPRKQETLNLGLFIDRHFVRALKTRMAVVTKRIGSPFGKPLHRQRVSCIGKAKPFILTEEHILNNCHGSPQTKTFLQQFVLAAWWLETVLWTPKMGVQLRL